MQQQGKPSLVEMCSLAGVSRAAYHRYWNDHAARELTKLLVRNFHGHHDMSLATLHVHLDDASCMEVTVLKGKAREVQHFAEHIIAERGVRHGRLVMIPAEPDGASGRGRERMFHRHA